MTDRLTIEQLQELQAGCFVNGWSTYEAVCNQFIAAIQENERLRKYAKHMQYCIGYSNNQKTDLPCSCGLDQLWNEVSDVG